jgi:hypothetical protein
VGHGGEGKWEQGDCTLLVLYSNLILLTTIGTKSIGAKTVRM